ncbi:MAG TPA: protein translocase subunit SecF [Patescibacteria group bacterium]|nr:protein translocase subunit SecF [Patescibacteria group bacterium]
MNWLKYKNINLTLSGFLIIISIISLLKWGLKIGVDFTGGSVIEYKIEENFSHEEVVTHAKDKGFDIVSVQNAGNKVYLFKLPPISEDQKSQLTGILNDDLKLKATEQKFESVGPAIGVELIKKTVYAMIIATVIILFWIAYQFKNLRFGLSATIATIHDSTILLGSFSILGKFFGAEVDFLFVTAMLTILSFSVHDTIVVFDRIRELKKRSSGDETDIINTALSQTMVRSLNNSFTILFMLFALVLLGGISVRWFAIALFIGTILGTYSSPFIAVPFYVVLGNLGRKIKNRKP